MEKPAKKSSKIKSKSKTRAAKKTAKAADDQQDKQLTGFNENASIDNLDEFSGVNGGDLMSKSPKPKKSVREKEAKTKEEIIDMAEIERKME
jgi:hypothetical protein